MDCPSGRYCRETLTVTTQVASLEVHHSESLGDLGAEQLVDPAARHRFVADSQTSRLDPLTRSNSLYGIVKLSNMCDSKSRCATPDFTDAVCPSECVRDGTSEARTQLEI